MWYETCISIIALIVHSNEEVIDKIFQAEIDSYLPKPFKYDLHLKVNRFNYIENKKVWTRNLEDEP